MACRRPTEGTYACLGEVRGQEVLKFGPELPFKRLHIWEHNYLMAGLAAILLKSSLFDENSNLELRSTQ